MRNYQALQRQKHNSSAAPSTSFEKQTPSFEPIPGQQPIALSGNLQTDLEQATRSGWSFESIATTRNDLAPEHRYAVNPPGMQGLASPTEPVMQQKSLESAEHKENTTGLPDNLKAGVENLSGISLDDVHVHYNSSKPSEVAALAYTQGSEIHVGPGQEQHLAHEAWHVVQQKQGRVMPTLQARGEKINVDQGLEHEADVKGKQASEIVSSASMHREQPKPAEIPRKESGNEQGVIQRVVTQNWVLIQGNKWVRRGKKWVYIKDEWVKRWKSDIIEKYFPWSFRTKEDAEESEKIFEEIITENTVPELPLDEKTIGYVQAGLPAYVDTILKKYPPTEYMYVGLGASAEQVCLCMRIRSEKEKEIVVRNIPISGIRQREQEESEKLSKLEEKESEKLSKRDEGMTEGMEALVTYIRKQLKEPTKKKILLMDVVSEGATLLTMKNILNYVFKNIEVSLLSLNNQNKDNEDIKRLQLGKAGDIRYEFASLVNNESLKPARIYAKYTINDLIAGERPKVNPVRYLSWMTLISKAESQFQRSGASAATASSSSAATT